MSDILERLKEWRFEKRDPAHKDAHLCDDLEACFRAAIAEIERLRAQSEELREAVRVLGTAIGAWVCSDDAYAACESNPIARAAIDGKENNQ